KALIEQQGCKRSVGVPPRVTTRRCGWICTDPISYILFLGSSVISGKHGVRCKEGYDLWIVRLGPAEVSDTLMKARTRRGHDGHDRTKQRLCLLSGLCPLCPHLSASS